MKIDISDSLVSLIYTISNDADKYQDIPESILKNIFYELLKEIEKSYKSNLRTKNIYSSALNKFGRTTQLIVSIEEMSELQKELCKLFRGIGNMNNIIEETADSEIMIEQVKDIFHIEDSVKSMRERKLSRLAEKVGI